MSAPEKEAGRIAIKFGSSSASSAQKLSRLPPSSSLGKRQRPGGHGLGGGSDSESEDDDRAHGRHEEITAIGADGTAISKTSRDRLHEKKRGLLVIERQPNRDWRTEARARGRRAHRSAPLRTTDSTRDTEEADADKPIRWGLTVTKRHDEDTEKKGEATGSSGSGADGQASRKAEEDTDKDSDTREKDGVNDNHDDHDKDDVEKEAVNALLGQTADDLTGTRRIIERIGNSASEDDVFKRDFNDAPDVSTLADYEAMPVEEFGAALLRGMGWDGKERGPKLKPVVRRPNQLGLGAKELKGAEDLGAWNHKSSTSAGVGSQKKRPPRLHDYRREEDKRRESREERYRDSYKAERDRERDRHRSGHHGSSSRHRSRYDR